MNDENRRPGPVSSIDLVAEADFPLGASRVSPSRLEVSRAGLHETLEPRIMQVLVALHRADGKVVSRDELIARCWEGRVVGEDAITRAIGRLRRLSEADDGASFQIETVPKIGFRLAAAAGRQSSADGLSGPTAASAQPPAEPGATERPPRGLPHGLMIVAAAALVAVGLLLWHYSRPANVVANSQPPPKPSVVSVAVLPFLNLSSDKEQEFFSDGMTEEITSALAKVPGLTVIGRTSAFQFKGENRDIRAIGKALGVSNLIEGSVRKDGNQVRITAQLINTSDGTERWTESYDRNLKGIFAVQEDIATAIAGALQVPLGLKPGQNLVSNRTTDIASYQDYLRARELFALRGYANLTQAEALLEHVIARDPTYAPAWALLANVYYVIPVYPKTYVPIEGTDRAIDLYLPKADAAAQKALSLDPNNVDAMAAHSVVASTRRKLIQAEDSMRQALRVDPNNLFVLNYLAHQLEPAGRLKEAVAVWQKMRALDPLDNRIKVNLAGDLMHIGQYDAALAIFRTLPQGTGGPAGIYAAQGRFQEAADQLLRERPGLLPPKMIEDASRLLRSAPTPVSSPQSLPRLASPNLVFVYLYVGAANRMLDDLEIQTNDGYLTVAADPLWWPAAAPLHKTERFRAYVRKAGLVDYWRARGWADACHPVGADDFACN